MEKAAHGSKRNWVVIGSAIILSVTLVYVWISTWIPADFWSDDKKFELIKTLLSGVFVAGFGGLLVRFNNHLLASRKEGFDERMLGLQQEFNDKVLERKEAFEKRAAVSSLQRELHSIRKENLSTVIALLLEIRWVAIHLRGYKLAAIEAQNGESPHEADHFYDSYRVLTLRSNDIYTQIMVAAELYGAFPEGVDLEPDRLSPYVTALAIQNMNKVVLDNLSPSEILNINQNITYLIRDLRTLVEAEEHLAKDAQGETTIYKIPSLDYLNMIKANVVQALPTLDELDTDCTIMQTLVADDDDRELKRKLSSEIADKVS